MGWTDKSLNLLVLETNGDVTLIHRLEDEWVESCRVGLCQHGRWSKVGIPLDYCRQVPVMRCLVYLS